MKLHTFHSSAELEQSCASHNIFMYLAPYWTAEIYGQGKYIREYGHFPFFLPLCVYSDHGVTNDPKPAKHELFSDAPTRVFFSQRKVILWKKLSAIPCHVLLSPFVYYRRSRNIRKNKDARGTLAFFSHSTPSIDVEVDIDNYISQLKLLPKIYHPISICLHMHDIKKGLHKKFIDAHIPVVTVGDVSSNKFVEKFYNLLRQAKFSTSNSLGSYTYYSIEMKIPFFLYGSKAKYYNKRDDNYPPGYINVHKININNVLVERLFGVNDPFKTKPSITHEQKQLTISLLGTDHSMSRTDLKKVLYFSLIKFIISGAVLGWAIRVCQQSMLNLHRKIILKINTGSFQ